MKYILNIGKNKKPFVILIHGYNQTIDSWNVTKSGKVIQLDKILSAKYNTIIIQIDQEDYLKSVPELSNEIHEKLSLHAENSKKIVLAHSYGCFYAISLAINHDKTYRLLLLDPTIKTLDYYEMIKNRAIDNDLVSISKYENYSLLPNYSDIKSKTIIIIHLANKNILEKISVLIDATKKNIKSRLMIEHCSHMVHWDIPERVCISVDELCNFL